LGAARTFWPSSSPTGRFRLVPWSEGGVLIWGRIFSFFN
jgi:hypothetical protein